MNYETDGEKVVKAGIGYTVGNILVKGIAFLTIPLFTVLMSTDQYGIYNTYSAYVSVMAVIVSLGLPSSVRNARYDFSDDEKVYHSSSILLILIVFILFLLLAFALKEQASTLLGISFSLAIIAVINSTCTALHSFYNNILTIDYSFRQFLRLSLFYSITSVILSIILIRFPFSQFAALGRAIGNMVPMIAIGIFVVISTWKKSVPQISKRYSQYGLHFGLPLIPNDLSALVLAQFDRIMIYRVIGASEAGLYSFAYNFAILFQVITASIESAWTPWMFEKITQEQLSELKRKISLFIVAISIGTILLLLPSPELLMLISDSAYWSSKTVVIPIIVSMYFHALAIIPVGIEFYYKKTSWISACTLLTAICNIALNMAFIPAFGYPAAAYTTLACYFLYVLFHLIAAKRLAGINVIKLSAVRTAMIGTNLAAILGVFSLEIPVLRLTIEGIIILVLSAVAFLHRKQIKCYLINLLNFKKNCQ